MISPISPSIPVQFEIPKPNLNSSKDTNLTSSDRFEKSHPKPSGTYSQKVVKKEELSALPPEPDLDLNLDPTKAASKEAWAEVKAWAKVMKDELKQQQAELVKKILEYHGRDPNKNEGKVLKLHLEVDIEIQPSESKPPEPKALVPEYWNAENTSDRIVRMATGFAKVSGLLPREFGEKIRAAIEEGFSGAKEVTGELPGAAGKLNQDTHDLVFTKLQKWLDAWEASAYNQSA